MNCPLCNTPLILVPAHSYGEDESGLPSQWVEESLVCGNDECEGAGKAPSKWESKT